MSWQTTTTQSGGPDVASIRKHTWADGETVSYHVLWRENGKQTSAAFADETTAKLFKTYLEAAGPAAAWEWAAQHDQATEPPDMLTLDTHVEHYITHLTTVSSGTRSEYRKMWARTFGPVLGTMPVDTITRDHVSTAINTLAERIGPKSIANAWGSLLSPAMADALDRELIRKNPCRGVKLPRLDDEDDEEILFLDKAEFAALYREVPEFWRPLVLTLVGTGARWGEATAWKRIDLSLEKATIRVSRAWKRIEGGWELGGPKTKKGRRTITLPPELVDTLRPLVDDRKPGDWLFTSRNGASHVHHANFYNRVWLPAVRRAIRCDKHWADPNPCGCEFTQPTRCGRHKSEPGPCGCDGTLTRWPRIHDLRHTHVSWLVAEGIQLPAIQRRLGHESIQTTWDIYGDLIPDLQVQAAAATSNALGGLQVRGAIEAGPVDDG